MKKKTLLFLAILLCLVTISWSQTYEIYVSDAGNFNNPPWQILKFDTNGENPEVFINEELAWPQDILFLEDQEVVLISSLNTGRITKHQISDGTFIEDFAAGIGGPTRMKIGPDGMLYVLQWSGNGKVLRYQLDGTFVDEFTSIGVTQSIGLDWDAEGNLYVSSWSGSSVRKFDTEGNDMGLFVSSSLAGPTNIWFDDNGDLLVANWSGTTIRRFDATGAFLSNFIGGLSNPEGIAIYPNGNILVGDGGTAAIKLYDDNGTYIEDFISGGAGGLLFPNAVVLRDITPVAVKEPEVVNDFVQPSLGTNFYLSTANTHTIELVEIYNAYGQLVRKKKVNDHLVWDASNVVEGLYFMQFTVKGSTQFVQKVMVQNR